MLQNHSSHTMLNHHLTEKIRLLHSEPTMYIMLSEKQEKKICEPTLQNPKLKTPLQRSHRNSWKTNKKPSRRPLVYTAPSSSVRSLVNRKINPLNSMIPLELFLLARAEKAANSVSLSPMKSKFVQQQFRLLPKCLPMTHTQKEERKIHVFMYNV